MKTENENSSHPQTPRAVSKTRSFIEGATLLGIALHITDAFEGILTIQLDPHSVLHYVIIMSIHASISFLYHKYKADVDRYIGKVGNACRVTLLKAEMSLVEAVNEK